MSWGGLLRSHHVEKSDAIAQRLLSGELMAGPDGVVRRRDWDGGWDEGRKRRRSPFVSPPRVGCADEQILLSSCGLSPPAPAAPPQQSPPAVRPKPPTMPPAPPLPNPKSAPRTGAKPSNRAAAHHRQTTHSPLERGRR